MQEGFFLIFPPICFNDKSSNLSVLVTNMFGQDFFVPQLFEKVICKVIREKSRGEGSLIVQDTIENVSEPKFFF